VGLRPYGVGDSDLFFGRGRESWQLTSLVLSSRFVVVYGHAGVGKTSLIEAGVRPLLGEAEATVLPIGRLPLASRWPVRPAPGENPLTLAVLSSWAPESSAGSLRGTSLRQFLQRVPVEADDYDDTPLPLVAVIDQFEEVVGDGPSGPRRRQDFLDQLAEALDAIEHLHLLLSVRHDAVGELLAHEMQLYRGTRRRFQVEPLDRDAAVAAVTGPLAATGRTFELEALDDLVSRLMTRTVTNDVGEQRTVVTDTVEPVHLQVVCQALWRTLSIGVTEITSAVTRERMQDPGDVESTLTSACARVVMDVAAEQQLPEAAVWDWLVGSFVTDLGTRGACHQGLAGTGAMPNAVAWAFEDQWILRSERRLGSVWFELMHDVLIEPIRRGKRLCDGLMADAAELAAEIGARAYLHMAETARRDGLSSVAIEYARGAARAATDRAAVQGEAMLMLGDLLVAAEVFDEAEGCFGEAAQLFDFEQDSEAVGRALAALGRLFFDLARHLEAVATLRAALERLPGAVAVRLDFARALMATGEVPAAIGEYTTVLVSAPYEAKAARVTAVLERGLANVRSGDAVSGLRDLTNAVDLDPALAERPDVVAARREAERRVEAGRLAAAT
jgi:hypothetical protein